MYTASFIFSYNLSIINMIVEEIYRHEKEFNSEMRIVNRFMEINNVENDIKFEVRKYFRHKFDADYELTKEEKEFVMKKL